MFSTPWPLPHTSIATAHAMMMAIYSLQFWHTHSFHSSRKRTFQQRRKKKKIHIELDVLFSCAHLSSQLSICLKPNGTICAFNTLHFPKFRKKSDASRYCSSPSMAKWLIITCTWILKYTQLARNHLTNHTRPRSPMSVSMASIDWIDARSHSGPLTPNDARKTNWRSDRGTCIP